jgi:hypothetical protein
VTAIILEPVFGFAALVQMESVSAAVDNDPALAVNRMHAPFAVPSDCPALSVVVRACGKIVPWFPDWPSPLVLARVAAAFPTTTHPL